MLIHKNQYRRSIWKNGQGFTDEIAIYPATASLAKGDFLWRLSSAHINQAAPFSLFPEHDRVLMILEGDGIRMLHRFQEGDPEEAVEIPRGEAYEFPGNVPTRCEPLGGAITDFSIFTRTGQVELTHEIKTLDAGETFVWTPSGRWNFAYAMSGEARVQSTQLNEGNTYATDSNEATFEVGKFGAQLFLISLASEQK